MKISMYLTDNAMQFNLEPENDHEKEFTKVLAKFSGEPAQIGIGKDIGLTKGNYLRNFGESSLITAVTIRHGEKAKSTEE